MMIETIALVIIFKYLSLLLIFTLFLQTICITANKNRLLPCLDESKLQKMTCSKSKLTKSLVHSKLIFVIENWLSFPMKIKQSKEPTISQI